MCAAGGTHLSARSAERFPADTTWCAVDAEPMVPKYLRISFRKAGYLIVARQCALPVKFIFYFLERNAIRLTMLDDLFKALP